MIFFKYLSNLNNFFTFIKATFTALTDMFVHLSEAFGGFLNGFVKSVFQGIGFLKYFEVLIAVSIFLFCLYFIKKILIK